MKTGKRKRRTASAALLILALLIGAGLSGCKEELPFIGKGDHTQTQKVVSNEISIPMLRVRTLNPLVSLDEDTYYISKLIYQGLFQLDSTLTAVPALAESYQYDSQGTTLTIQLKRGVSWQDGKPFTSSDVEFTIETLLALPSGSTLYGDYVQNIRSVRTQGNNTVVISFKSPDDVSVSNLTFPILPEHQFKKASDARMVNSAFVPIGTGPYAVESADVSKEVILKGYPGFIGGPAANNIMHFKVLPNRMDAVNLFDINDFSIAFSKDLDRETLLTNKDVKVVSFPSNEVEYLGFRCDQPVLQDARVRRAISLAIDDKEIIETAYYNSGMQNDTLYYPNYLGVSSEKKHRKADQSEEAEQNSGKAGPDGKDGQPSANTEQVGQDVQTSANADQNGVADHQTANADQNGTALQTSAHADPSNQNGEAGEPPADTAQNGEDEASMKTDLAQAKKLLAEAGLTDQNGDGYLEDHQGKEITLRILYNSDDPSRATAAQVIKQDLKKLKIHAEPDGREWSAYNAAVTDGAYDLYIGGYQIRENYDLRFLLKTGVNPVRYSNPQLDALLDQMASGITETQKKETFQQIHDILLTDMPYDCLLYKTYGAIASSSFQGTVKPVFFNFYNGSESWINEFVPAEAPAGDKK